MARLPQPGGDSGNWGDILNDFLNQSLKTDGTIKDNAVTATALAPNSVTNTALASDSVNATTIADGSITEALLATAVQTKLNAPAPVTKVAGKTGDVSLVLADLNDINATGATNNQVLTFNSTTSKWSASTVSSTTVSDASTTSKGIVQLAGDLGGGNDPTAPTIAANAISTAKIADTAVTKAKLETSVQTSLGKADTAVQSADLAATEKTANKGQANGYAALDGNSRVPSAQLGSGTANNTTYLRGDGSWAAGAAAPDATTGAKGVVQLAGDLGGTAASPTVPGLANKVSTSTANATYAQFINLARNPDLIITGTINRDGNGAITTAGVTWPDGTVGTLTTDTASTAFPGAVDAYHVTYGSPATKTFTQPAITRDSTTGQPTNIPAITVS